MAGRERAREAGQWRRGRDYDSGIDPNFGRGEDLNRGTVSFLL